QRGRARAVVNGRGTERGAAHAGQTAFAAHFQADLPSKPALWSNRDGERGAATRQDCLRRWAYSDVDIARAGTRRDRARGWIRIRIAARIDYGQRGDILPRRRERHVARVLSGGCRGRPPWKDP